MLLSVELPTNRRRLYFWLNMIIAGLHVPPFVNPSVIPPEAQLFIFLRIITLVKFMRKGFLIYISLQIALLQSIQSLYYKPPNRHNHPMKFGNVIELVSTISPVELEDSDFLLKTYFVKYPLSMLFCLYTYVVFVLGYTIFVLGKVSCCWQD